ncbi:DUF6538 domain-containing protein [Mucilaginibacter psychrotolerans]|uniref:Tyr recombinase domain-containing protein n=1 Tax=Mucilaginibacter psychrotolerans TaxID=1524096 RepID=A0A4Y8SB50_9SPHI|nr:DUF6538 domain-containing protein [Mucilaginibacter psychrotolerans]TFF36198.1 hypothetical protein E2R66_16795 [Mucilaginibacter psychrotolerans]
MQHLIHRANTYYFNRRVPLEIKEYDPRPLIRFSLKTDSRTQAMKLAALKNIELENYWKALIETGQKHSHTNYKQVVDRASLFGFNYQSSQELAIGPLPELINRLLFVAKSGIQEKPTEAVLGGVAKPEIKLDDALTKFWDLSNDVVLSKSAHQIKKWKNPRRLAMKNLISCIGNKVITELNRDDLLKFRDWWINRILNEELKNCGANKNFKQLKSIISRVSDHYKLNIDTKHLFHKLKLDDDTESRSSFSTDYILNTLLNADNLSGMKDEYKNMIFVFAETGVGIDEQAGVLPEDIILDDTIPHIVITPRPKNKLKTKYRKRLIPLTGFALDAFKKYPLGFSTLIDNPDSISSAIAKYLKENDLLPTDKHSLYSLRHSFQDRLLAVNTPDRVQADLMGHKFVREAYGNGSTLEQKKEWMLKIQLL